MKKSTLYTICAVVVAAAALLPSKCGSQATAAPATPTPADSILDVALPSGVNPRIIKYEGFTVAFNSEKHLPEYVAWELTPHKANGTAASRKEADFEVDPDVPGCATLDDYRRSGFDRGHMAPAADMKWSRQAMADCHYLTNICPQHSSLNSRAWNTVEKNCRKWTERYGTLYIIAGPVLSDYMPRTIGQSQVPVPERFFKVIIAPYANPPKGIAFIMPNQYIQGGAASAVTSIDQVEEITGFDFFHNLPDDIENAVESQHALNAWNH